MRTFLTRIGPAAAAVVVAAATCLAAASAVDAQTPPPGAMPPHGDHGGPWGHGMRMVRELDRLKASLQLNAQQAALWDRAAANMKPPGDMRDQMKARHDRMAAMLDDPAFDPRKLAAEMDRADADRRARMTSMRDAWFAVYDSLNATQRGQVREFLRERMEHGRHRMEWMHRGHDGDRDGPMPPPSGPSQAPQTPAVR